MGAVEPDANRRCRLCGQRFESAPALPSSADRRVTCRICGEYDIDNRAWYYFAEIQTDPSDRHLLSALTRTAPVRGVGRVLISPDSFVALREGRVREPNFAERRDALLDWFAFESRKDPKSSAYGRAIQFDPQCDYPVAYCRPLEPNWAEWKFIIDPLFDRQLLAHGTGAGRPMQGPVWITDKGWEQLEMRPRASGSVGFVAMKFKEMDPVYEAIAAGIEQAGYRPTRIDREDYIGGVMDQIVAKIRESRFVVADFTGNRGGVYYEAGFAFGLNMPVFTLCRHDHLEGDDRVHFDVQHLNLLTWQEGNLADLTARLEARIVAVLGRGPVTEPNARDDEE